MMIRVACVRGETEYAVAESRTPGEARWKRTFIWLAIWRWENSSLPEIENTVFQPIKLMVRSPHYLVAIARK